MVKLMSGDPTWRSLSALHYHYETQPLPTPLAWYFYQLPIWFHKLSCALMFGAEIFVPLLFFLPQRFRKIAFGVEVGLQTLILLTGNYGYFNWLTISLCLLLLDDDCFSFLPARFQKHAPFPDHRQSLTTGIGGLILFFSLVFFLSGNRPSPGVLETVMDFAGRFRLTSTYGLFAVMTTERDEIVIEGSQDKVTWKEYEFPWKPGDVRRAPSFVAPHQPRADWQAWFAALSRFEGEEWLLRLCLKVLKGESTVSSIFSVNPFPDVPPEYLRILRYRYHFTTWTERKASGAWWKRELLGDYSPVLSLRRGAK
jgi:hypothetical protein